VVISCWAMATPGQVPRPPGKNLTQNRCFVDCIYKCTPHYQTLRLEAIISLPLRDDQLPSANLLSRRPQDKQEFPIPLSPTLRPSLGTGRAKGVL
jgi:hypothetical protein